MNQWLKNFIRRTIYKLVSPPRGKVKNSNSQAGEDRILNFLFNSMGLKDVSYIDIGANDPVVGNNTYLLYTQGNRGILVEPDSYYLPRIRETRPKDTTVEAAVSISNGEAEFYVFDEPSLNTLSSDESIIRLQTGKYKLLETRKIRLITLEEIIQKYLNGVAPHLISLDVEGIDFSILNSFNFETYRVPVWVVETCEYSENHIKAKVQRILDLMAKKGYFVYADTYINTIFVNKNWFQTYRDAS